MNVAHVKIKLTRSHAVSGFHHIACSVCRRLHIVCSWPSLLLAEAREHLGYRFGRKLKKPCLLYIYNNIFQRLCKAFYGEIVPHVRSFSNIAQRLLNIFCHTLVRCKKCGICKARIAKQIPSSSAASSALKAAQAAQHCRKLKTCMTYAAIQHVRVRATSQAY
jgi:hypothetical protein